MVAALLALAAAAPAAPAVDRIYWTTLDAIRVGNLDGSGSAATMFAGERPSVGIAIDSAAGRIYWVNTLDTRIRVGNLDGSGSATTLYAGEDQPRGLAIDPAAGKIYWANRGDSTIRVGNVDGSGSASTLYGGESVPEGVAIDPAAGKIYWANSDDDTIRVGNLDGSGSAATLFSGQGDPVGIAIDPAAGRIYWTSFIHGSIRVGNLDGSGSVSTLLPAGRNPGGVALDPLAGRIHWANFTPSGTIRVENLDGSGSASTLFAGEQGPFFPALLRAPAGAGPPHISGVAAVGSPLACTRGGWAPDLLGGFLFRAPQSFRYQWLLNGAEIPGATSGSYTPTASGSYSCRVTATNHAGSTAQTSAAVDVLEGFELGRLKRNERKGHAHLQVLVPGPGVLGYRGKGERRAGRSLARAGRDVSGGAEWLKIKPGRFGKRSDTIRRKLRRTGKAKVKVFVTYARAGGAPSTLPRKLRLLDR